VAKLLTPGPGGAREQWRAGGILAQFLPQSPERMRVPDISGGDGDPRDVTNEPADNSWRELVALLGTIEPTELIDPTIGAERLLYRLFHEHGVRVFGGVPVADQCSCSRDKIRGILEGFSAERSRRAPRMAASTSPASSARHSTTSTRPSSRSVRIKLRFLAPRSGERWPGEAGTERGLCGRWEFANVAGLAA